MKKVYLFIFAFLFFIIVHCTFNIENCICQWYQISLPVSGSVLQMQFINSNTGWVVVSQSGYGYSMLRTTNQGTNWFTIYSDSSKVGRFQFVNDTLGYALGESHGYALISKTTNSGYNWTIVRSSFSDVNNGFYMVSKDTGWVNIFRFPQNVTMRTTNGFQTLEDVSFVGGGTPSTLYFFKEKYNSEHFGYMQGSGHLWKTTNSGFNWQEINMGESGNVNSFSFLNKDTGWVAIPFSTYGSSLYLTKNGGINWSLQFYKEQGDLITVQAVNKKKVWCGATYNNKVLISVNGGLNWGYQTSQISNNQGIYMFDTSLGFAWNNYLSNNLVRTTNGGGVINKIANSKEQIANEYKLYQNYPNPFNAVSSIKYKVLRKADIKIKLYNVIGKEITTLVNKKQSQGTYEIKFQGENLSSGIYFYSLFIDGKIIDTKKLILLK